MDSDGKNVKFWKSTDFYLLTVNQEPYPPYELNSRSIALVSLLARDADIMIENTRSQRKVKIANGGDADWKF